MKTGPWKGSRKLDRIATRQRKIAALQVKIAAIEARQAPRIRAIKGKYEPRIAALEEKLRERLARVPGTDRLAKLQIKVSRLETEIKALTYTLNGGQLGKLRLRKEVAR